MAKPYRTAAPREFYETPPQYVYGLHHYLIPDLAVGDTVYEPCVGEGAIVTALNRLCQGLAWRTNDRDEVRPAGTHFDASDPYVWKQWEGFPLGTGPDWVISNPPFSIAAAVFLHAVQVAKKGVALHVRLSWAEATRDRWALLQTHATDRLVLPRYSFGPNKDGEPSKDTTTPMWVVWRREVVGPGWCPGLTRQGLAVHTERSVTWDDLGGRP